MDISLDRVNVIRSAYELEAEHIAVVRAAFILYFVPTPPSCFVTELPVIIANHGPCGMRLVDRAPLFMCPAEPILSRDQAGFLFFF